MRFFWFDWPMRCATVVTVISEETKRQLLRQVSAPECKIVVVPDAVAPVYQPYPKPFRTECPQILHVGTKPNKNLSRLIQAVRGLTCHVKIIGVLNDAQRRELESSGISYDAEGNLGGAAMYRAYCDADLVSFPSIYEGFGMPIIEAQWVERPVVTSNCSSMPEVAGGAACLVDPFDVGSIRAGIQRVIEDGPYRESLIELGRKNRERFSLAQVARQYAALYASVMTSAKG
jgi:glycosyltransferase involved in cell wall biosynthesis